MGGGDKGVMVGERVSVISVARGSVATASRAASLSSSLLRPLFFLLKRT